MTELVRYIETLKITQGEGAGQPFRVLPWQARFIRGAFSVPGDAALTVGRGGGKSTLCGAISAAGIDGPLRRKRADVVVVAGSFDQARIIYDHAKAFLGEQLQDRKIWRVWDTAQRAVIEHKPTGAKLVCRGADKNTLHGLAPLLVLADEPAQWKPSQRDAIYSALRTSMGKIPGSRLIALGTRPKDQSHWFQKLLDGGADYSQCHAARETDPKFQRRTWLRANPSLDAMPTLEARIRAEARDARTDPNLLAQFDSLRLNLGTSDVVEAMLLDPGVWEGCEGDAETGSDYVLGVDLGGSSAMTAASAYWPSTGRLEAVAAFSREPSLETRGIRDGVGRLYIDIAKRGELIQLGTHTPDISAFLDHCLERWGKPSAIVADRYAEDRLREALAGAGFPFTGLILRGQGFRDGAEDVDRFRRAVLRGEVTPVKSLLLRSAMMEARTVADASQNEKLAKSGEGKRTRGRDDAVAASILAVAEGSKWNKRKPADLDIRIVRAV